MTSLSQTAVNLGEPVLDSEEVVPSSLEEIAPILRVADEVEAANPRVAYLCRLHAFEAAHRLDPTSSSPGVRQFITALIERLQRENVSTLTGRAQKSDTREIQTFYRRFYKNYVQAHQKQLQNASDRGARAQLTKAYHAINVLFEVLKEVTQQHSVKADDERNALGPVSSSSANAASKEPVFACPVCLDKMEQPSATSCGHIFCKKCIMASIKAQKKCPTCRNELGSRDFLRVYLPETTDQD